MEFLKWLEHLDKVLFVLIQHDSDHAVLDKVMPYLRDPYTWVPLYAFMLYYAFRVGKNKAWAFITLTLLTFAITDSLTTQVLKPLFGRLRPCHDAELAAVIREVIDCGGLYSLPSTHATNHFGLAAFWYFSILKMTGKKWHWLWVWAAAVCYAQVYVGKHYPLDILLGSVIGFFTGFGVSRIFIYWYDKKGDRRPGLPVFFSKSPEYDRTT